MQALVTSAPSAKIVSANKPLVDALLAMNTRNRKLRQSAVDRLEDEIKSGHWKLTASGIGVDRDGVLSDGQHRLVAIKQAGYPPVEFLLMTGLDPDAQQAVDRHAKRSLADALSFVQQRTISNQMVAVANSLLSIKGATDHSAPFIAHGHQPSDSATASALFEWEDDINAVLSVGHKVLKAPVSAALCVYYRHEPEKAMALADQIRRGVGLAESDPAYRLRAALASIKGGGATQSLRAFALTVTASIAHSEGRKMKLIKPSESWTTAPWKPWRA